MINGKRIIALCLSRINDSECCSLIKGLSEELFKHNCKLFVYSTCTDFDLDSPADIGQASIFNLMDYSVIDAVVIYDIKFKVEAFRDKIADAAERHGVPVIHLRNLEHGLNASFDFKEGFAQIVRHVIDFHGVKNVHFMAGVKGNPVSEHRIKVTKETMAAYGLELRDEDISYGDFWSGPAEEATNKLIDEGRVPEAFICANDSMAICVCSVLKKHGYRVPEDVLVTGFDGIEEIKYSTPCITSVKCSLADLGAEVGRIIPEVLSGKLTEGSFRVLPKLMLAGSCGCEECSRTDAADYLTTMYNNHYVFRDNEHKLFVSSVQIQMAETLEEASKAVDSDINYNTFVLLTEDCIDETISPRVNRNADSFGEQMCLFYDASAIYAGSTEPIPRMFRTKDIIPNIEWHLNDMYPLIFSAINLLDVPIGYVCFHYFSIELYGYMKIPQRIDSLSSAISGLRFMRHQRYLTSQIEQLYKCDSLTKLNNRNAFNKEYEQLISSLGKNEYISVILADLDNLKGINDNFGHDEGDNAICVVADALRHIFEDNAVCCRFGGDEMIAVTKHRVDEKTVKSSFEEYFAEYNRTSQKPYRVGASVGVYTVEGSDRFDFEELFKEADKKMYEEKVVRRAKIKAGEL